VIRRLATACFALAGLLGAANMIYGQAQPAAIRPITEQAGVGFSYARSDYGQPYIKGITGWGDVRYHDRIGLEANVHINSIWTPLDIGENTYMVGPIVSLIHQDRMNVYAKGMGGIGQLKFQASTFTPQTYTYGIYAVGAGIEFRASRRINLRPIDIEEQWWPGFYPKGLSPFTATFGAAYEF
jgi:hypothetical protein